MMARLVCSLFGHRWRKAVFYHDGWWVRNCERCEATHHFEAGL